MTGIVVFILLPILIICLWEIKTFVVVVNYVRIQKNLSWYEMSKTKLFKAYAFDQIGNVMGVGLFLFIIVIKLLEIGGYRS